MRAALIVGLSGPSLSREEAAFLAAARPCGIILFARNCVAPEQVRRLADTARVAVASDDLLVLVDQEGGRVRRLRPPDWPDLPAAASFARLYERDAGAGGRATHLVARLTADALRACGINTNCAPVLDVPVPGAHAIIGDRAYGVHPATVTRLGRCVAEGFLAGGVLPVMKHIPGHGRALADSHLELPIVSAPRAVLAVTDFEPFRALADLPAAMTAHVVFTDIDQEAPASTSVRVTRDVIRGEIGFDGLLMSDDIGMQALTGSMRARAEAVIRAGSDLALHCSGNLGEMEGAAAGVPVLAGQAEVRFARCLARLGRNEPFNAAAAEAALAEALRVA